MAKTKDNQLLNLVNFHSDLLFEKIKDRKKYFFPQKLYKKKNEELYNSIVKMYYKNDLLPSNIIFVFKSSG